MRPVSRIGFPKPRRLLNPAAPLLGRLGKLETRLARSKAEIRAAQAVRYQVFYNELGALAAPAMKLLRRDKDDFDRHCDHLLVIDNSNRHEEVVGTYRLLLDAHAASGFYSEREFDLAPLKTANKGKRMMELGRSCILPEFRSKRVMELLWQGIWAYSVNNCVDILFGCASFSGTDPDAHSTALSWLANNAMMEEGNCSSSVAQNFALTDISPRPADDRGAIAAMPPLLKGYIRLGAKIGSHAVIDHQFDTIDVLVVMKVADINPRYIAHYGADASRFAA